MSSQPTKRLISREDWDKKLAGVKICKSDLNRLVMNYLVIEGYKDAAEKFQQESGTDRLSKTQSVDLDSIADRMAIRAAIQRGDVVDAIERVNDLDPEILDNNPRLYFHLQQQRLIELIRENKIQEALEFAQEELAPRGEENTAFLSELERTMALLAFEDPSQSPLAELLDNSQRQKMASELNAAILTSQCQEKDPKLPVLLKMLVWAQNQLDDKVLYPRMNDLATGAIDTNDPMQVSSASSSVT